MKLPNVIRKAPLWGFFALSLLVFSTPLSATPCCAIASAHPLATRAGMQTLRDGGNAFDAAVTVSAVLAVVEPYSSGLGGGGFWLLHRAADNRQVMIDGRETAPSKATPDMYLDASGQPVEGLSINGALAAGIPGEPAALVHLAQNYGRLPLSRTLQPAIDLARDGFEIDDYYRKMASWRLDALQRSIAASRIFLKDGVVPPVGHRITQPDLANTLQQLADKGFDGFYRGPVASKLVKAVKKAGGIWRPHDLADYRVIERQPVVFEFDGKRIVTAALPSSGGVVMAQTLKILELFDRQSLSNVQRKHLLIEAMRRAYQTRAEYLGDSDFVEVPVARLLADSTVRRLAESINSQQASVSLDSPAANEGTDTTHFSIIDREGNRVAATLSINYPFGSGFVAEGTGVLLNDEMDDFAAAPGIANVYGLVGNDKNAIAPGKRMLSSMTPTFVESDKGIAVLGTPGGSRIISMVTQAILAMQHTDNPQDWVDQPRFHHQYLPDFVEYETGAFTEQEIQQLSAMGHSLREKTDGYGDMQVVYLDLPGGKLSAASDARGIGAAQVE
jgi:gamma-glutamyltranspeptidase/glutathione hydrolase